MVSEVPTAVKLNVAASTLQITWADGHVSRYAGAYLRHICPCAGCRGHAPGERPPPTWEQVQACVVRHVEAVGSYALQFTLSDQHGTGIYTWPYLRRCCPSDHPELDDLGRPLSANNAPSE